MIILGYILMETCGACPEQYDVFDKMGDQVAYLRLRHGRFTAEVPDVGGTVVYTARTDGDGFFADYERDTHLTNAIMAVDKWVKEKDNVCKDS